MNIDLIEVTQISQFKMLIQSTLSLWLDSVCWPCTLKLFPVCPSCFLDIVFTSYVTASGASHVEFNKGPKMPTLLWSEWAVLKRWSAVEMACAEAKITSTEKTKKLTWNLKRRHGETTQTNQQQAGENKGLIYTKEPSGNEKRETQQDSLDITRQGEAKVDTLT